MWFKNLTIFIITEPFILNPAELHVMLEQAAFRPCGSHEEFTSGWTSPVGKSSEQLVHSHNGCMMLCAKKEEKILPASVVNEMTQEKILEVEQNQGRKLSKKERTAIKDEIIFDLLPRAFTHSSKTYAYIDTLGGRLIVDEASASKAEDVLSLLRKCLGSLPAVPINTIAKPSSVMTDWMANDQAPDDITIDNECELREPEEEGGIIRCKRHDLSLPEIKNHLDTGKEVLKLAVTWSDRLSFMIDENLVIKRLKFLDLIQDKAAETETESEVDRFDADFSIMSLELANFLLRLLELFGGEVKAN